MKKVQTHPTKEIIIGMGDRMDRKLRKMKKIELLEILLEQEQEIERLQTENEELQKQLDHRRLQIEEAGSIAEAALRLSGVFEAAQKAADIYLQSVKTESEDAENIEEIQDRETSVDHGDRERTDTLEGETESE